MTNITVTPEELQIFGETLKSLSEQLADTMNKVSETVSSILNSWTGLAHDAYFNMYEEMKKSLEEFPGLVAGLGDTTVKSAEAFAGVDEELQKAMSNSENNY